MMPVGEKKIEERSYHIWEREGRPEGRDQQHWFQAKAELEAEGTAPKAPSKTRRSAAATTGRKTASPRKRGPATN